MTMCTSCGAALGDGARFCSNCGAAVASVDGFQFARDVKDAACNAAGDIIGGAEKVVTDPLSKKIAAGAAVGAVMAAPLPIIGWAAGATIGAGLVAIKHLTQKA